MSKSRESLPLKRIVEEYGADSLRYSLMTFSIGADFEFTPEFVRRGKLFMQKVWSAYRFSTPYIGNINKHTSKSPVDNWILQRLKDTVTRMTKYFDSYELNDGLEVFHNFFWHELCDEYLEAIKHRVSYDEDAKNTLSQVMWTSLRLLAPIMPHLAEEIYQRLFLDKDKLSIHAAEWPLPQEILTDDKLAELGSKIIYTIKEARKAKASSNIPLGQRVPKVVIGIPQDYQEVASEKDTIRSTLRADEVEFVIDSQPKPWAKYNT